LPDNTKTKKVIIAVGEASGDLHASHLVKSMLKQVKKIAPTVFEKAGPNCLRMQCQEGKYKCENPPKASDFKP